MPETKTNQPAYKISTSFWRSFYNRFLDWVNQFLIFFSLRQNRKFFGIVYDSVSKQPLDPVIIKLAYSDERGADTSISAMTGKYAFLARPGVFKILARKSNYTFPSRLVKGDSDGVYHNLYHGEFIQLEDDYQVVAPNIPMDPVAKDWNQTAKFAATPHHPYEEYFLKRLVALFFWFGFFWAALLAYLSGWNFSWRYDGLLMLYGAIILFSLVVGRPRLLGKINQIIFLGNELKLELTKPELPGVVLGKTEAVPDGRFLLRANPGRYDLVIKHVTDDKRRLIGQVKVRVGSEGVVNQTIKIEV